MPTSTPRRVAGGFELIVSATTGKAEVPFLIRKVRAAHALLEGPLRRLSVALVGDRTMSRLHEQYLAEPGPTDVLSFELEHDRRGRVTAGEVVVCVPQAAREARRLGHPVRNELLLYTIHGMLHLMGHDDQTEAGFRKMHRMEDEVLSRLGVGRTFDPAGNGAAASVNGEPARRDRKGGGR